MTNERVYTGSCFCGEVRFKATGQPVAMGYCQADRKC